MSRSGARHNERAAATGGRATRSRGRGTSTCSGPPRGSTRARRGATPKSPAHPTGCPLECHRFVTGSRPAPTRKTSRASDLQRPGTPCVSGGGLELTSTYAHRRIWTGVFLRRRPLHSRSIEAEPASADLRLRLRRYHAKYHGGPLRGIAAYRSRRAPCSRLSVLLVPAPSDCSSSSTSPPPPHNHR